MQITFNTPQEETDWQDFCERLSAHLGKQVVASIDVATAIELLREMQERGLTYE